MSQISLLMYYLSEKELFSWPYLLKKTPRKTKILISPIWNKILKIWDIKSWAHKYRSTMQQELAQNFFTTGSWSFWKYIGKEPQNHAQDWKICILYIYWEYLVCLQSNAYGRFLQTCINFVGNASNFLTLKVA